MTKRLELFEQARTACGKLLAEWPGKRAIQLIISQLEYLIALEEGTSSDRTRLKDLTIGVLAFREIEPLSMEIAELLGTVADEARSMSYERKTRPRRKREL